MYPKTLAEVPVTIRARVAVERRIVKKTVDALLAAGFALQTDQAGDERVPAVPTRDRAVILDALCETDDERLFAYRGDEQQDVKRERGWVYFVYGNDGPDVICDYTVNLDAVLEPVNAYASTLE